MEKPLHAGAFFISLLRKIYQFSLAQGLPFRDIRRIFK